MTKENIKPAIGVDPAGSIKELGKRLAAMLEEDQWNHIEPFLVVCESDSAARIAELEAEVRILKETKENIWSGLKAKEAENATLKADAARWQHIRENGVYDLQWEYGECGFGSYRGEDADEAIDAVMGAK